ncbi:hypothetical protein AB595_27420 [Massilia sp. WF1]|uniref:acyltransferase family protein n=1 Tax=unclassified Massilia TaxID=2609279 RepID=UPI000690C3AB|nr:MULTISPECIES: acyltransferase family protein [unclassified Massilia]ALK95184.1 hypothetical protein AM586_01625 [Massilia sp. WG5]KNZ67487.1 hypothetical protein AB595_27420 [Massilia sp. WF1]
MTISNQSASSAISTVVQADSMYVSASVQVGSRTSTFSFNYSLFKVLSILMVVTSHWFSNLPLWLPTTVGLFIFAFSSALFTTHGYSGQFDVTAFWRKKLRRLLVRYWFLLFFVSVLVLIEGRTLFHWHSLIHVFGLSAFLDLFSHNRSGLGKGLWFFTVLLLFYIVFPYLAKLCAASGKDFFLPLVVTALFMFLNLHILPGFALWLTMLGFFLGVYVGMYGTEVSSRLSLTLALGSMLAIFVLNVAFGYKEATQWLVLLVCISINLWILKAHLPQWRPLVALATLETCLLEIFIIHSYFFVHPSGNTVLDFLASLSLIIVLAWILNFAGSKLVRLIFK